MSRLAQIARHAAAVSLMLLVGVLVSACANKPAPQNVDDGQTKKSMHTVGDAEAAFDAAEKEIGDLVLMAGVALPQPSAEEDPPPSPAPGGLQSQPIQESRLTQADRCTRACTALASMQRAADRVCELAGEEDTRCKSVRARVVAARDVVKAACPDCA